MTKKERAAYVRTRLDEFFPDPPIPLEHHDAYTLLVAVLLSAQCTDVRVNKTTPALWKLADNPADMARQSVDAINAIVRPCGLAPRKAQNIRDLSQILVDQYGGQVPDTLEALEALPGVGHKTASVAMVQAFGEPAFPVDTHIHRLAARWRLSKGTSVVQTERDLKALYPKDSWAKLHLQIIHYGRTYCTARGCDGTQCPVCSALNGRK